LDLVSLQALLKGGDDSFSRALQQRLRSLIGPVFSTVESSGPREVLP
jgi:hypothetical protein